MKKFWKHIIDICYDKETGVKKRIVFSIGLILIGFGILFWFFIRLLFFEGHMNLHHNINLPDAGLMGDFLGGVSGTLFTLVGVILLFETLALQRTELAESRKVFEKQQFENTFFNLMTLYQNVVKSLHFDNPTFYSEKTYHGKDYFEQIRKEIYDEFQSENSISRDRKKAKLSYLNFYENRKEQTAHYFRTIYRIFKFVNESNFEKKDKMNYAKIVRAQISESELFLLHYNAYTEYGKKFRQLINEFNITKHLPTLEKLEFKKHVYGLDHLEKNAIGMFLNDLKLLIKSSVTSQKEHHKNYLQGSISLKVSSSSPANFKVTIIKKEKIQVNTNFQQGFGLNRYSLEKLELFLNDYIYDLTSISNYFELNGKEIFHKVSVTTSNLGDKHTIVIESTKRNNDQIKIN
jgi:hypothetical protein